MAHALLRVATVLVAVLAGLGLMSAPDAAAESSSTITAQYPWPHNGCTIVPDNPSGVSFTYACNHHDGCYAKHWASKNVCDLWFLKDMHAACLRYVWAPNYSTCEFFANAYFVGVQVKGAKYYNSKGEYSRINTPMTTKGYA